jgi:hypothetical protein
LELVAQEQILDRKVVPLTEEGGQSRQEDAREFKHPGRVADRTVAGYLARRSSSSAGGLPSYTPPASHQGGPARALLLRQVSRNSGMW